MIDLHQAGIFDKPDKGNVASRFNQVLCAIIDMQMLPTRDMVDKTERVELLLCLLTNECSFRSSANLHFRRVNAYAETKSTTEIERAGPVWGITRKISLNQGFSLHGTLFRPSLFDNAARNIKCQCLHFSQVVCTQKSILRGSCISFEIIFRFFSAFIIHAVIRLINYQDVIRATFLPFFYFCKPVY